jgi:hypothetical protein
MSANQPPPQDPNNPQHAPRNEPPAREREVVVTSGGGPGAAIGIAVAVLVLVVAGFLFFRGGSDEGTTVEVPDTLELDVEVDGDGGGDGGDTGTDDGGESEG